PVAGSTSRGNRTTRTRWATGCRTPVTTTSAGRATPRRWVGSRRTYRRSGSRSTESAAPPGCRVRTPAVAPTGYVDRHEARSRPVPGCAVRPRRLRQHGFTRRGDRDRRVRPGRPDNSRRRYEDGPVVFGWPDRQRARRGPDLL